MKGNVMDEILEILSNDARKTPLEISKLTGKPLSSVTKAIKQYEKNGTIVKYKTIINQELIVKSHSIVRALIEVSITPQKDAGFDNVAERIYSFPEVISCYLVSGTYDLLVIVEGDDLQMVSNFIASKLSSLPNVRSTATHFMLKKYKEDGHVLKIPKGNKRLSISY